MFTEERALWLYQNYRWLEQHLSKHQGRERTPLILPTPQFFPQRNTGDDALAASLFESTRAFMGMEEWACVLRPHSEDELNSTPTLPSANAGESQSRGAAGTFSAADGQVCITYAPSLVTDPPGLVATFAHELCHYLLATVREPPPCGWSEHEPLTDLAAVHEGFGVFLCNTAFQFSQWTSSTHYGWRTGTRGYLNTAELGFALAVFCIRNTIDPELAMKHLKPNPAEVFWDSLGYVEDLEANGA